MTRSYVDYHVLQTVPPSNVNRDDTGSPKTAIYGGVVRARVSSQAWKRATRKDFEGTLDKSELGVRTKRVIELLTDALAELAPEADEDTRLAAVLEVVKVAKLKVQPSRKEGALPEVGYLVFLSRGQIDALARLAHELVVSGAPAAADQKRAAQAIKDQNSIDLALFGRMIADVSDLNVDASAQVAHALSIHAVANEFDFYTAVDDHKADSEDEDAGAGMIGTVEFNSSTLYRYATVNVEQLSENLGDQEAVRRAVSAFTRSFVKSLPTGKQNTFANRTLPDAVVVTIRDDQPVNWVGAFEAPIEGPSRIGSAADALADHAQSLEQAFGSHRTRTWVVRVGDATAALDALGDRVSFDDLVEAVGAAIVVEGEPVS